MDSKMFLASSNGKASNFFVPPDKAIKFGRKEMKVPDIRLSREHLELTANYKDSTVTVKNLSQYPSHVGDVILKKEESAILKPGDVLKVVRQYEFKLVINDATPTKRKHSAKGQSSSKEIVVPDSDDDEEVAQKLQKLQETALSQRKTPATKRSLKAADFLKSFGEGDIRHESCKRSSTGWRTHLTGDMMLYESAGLQHASKIVAFDLDGTIIETKSGKTFPVDCDDWEIGFPAGKKLQELHKKGFKIVFITNQAGIAKLNLDPEQFQRKVEAIVAALKVPVQVFVLTCRRGIYRKPGIGVFEYLQTNANGSIKFNHNDFVYVGDAAGRPKGWALGKKKDFSCSDRCFALNIGCEFFTPEEFFSGTRKNTFDLPNFDPRNLSLSLPLVKSSSGENGGLISTKPEIVVFVGYPASGKSSFAKTHFEPKGYVIINQDTLKTKGRCMSACVKAVDAGQSCVIDNTNVDEKARKSYIGLAKAKGVPIRCVYFDMSIDHVFHNNKFRAITDPARGILSQIVIYTYRKHHQAPTIGEGFNQVLAINFVPEFKQESHRALYNQFLSG